MTRCKGKAVWLTRDMKKPGGPYQGAYKLWLLEYHPARSQDYIKGYWSGYFEGSFCPELFESITGYTLKPGAGPVKVRIRVERVP